MAIFFIIRRLMDSVILKSGYKVFVPVMVLHIVVTYLMLLAAEETGITDDPVNFIYWYYTTTTTVGFGDITPKSDAGKLIASLWVMAGGIILVTGLIGAVTSSLMNLWRNRLKGNVNFTSMRDHTVIVGWYGEQSERMIDLLIAESANAGEKIVLCDESLEENPLPEKILFVKGESISSLQLLAKAGIEGASRIIVTGANDDQTLAVVLAINSMKHEAHLVAHFNNSQSAALAKQYVKNLEVASSMAMEILVRSARDPGTSDVIYDLLSIDTGVTLLSQVFKHGFQTAYSRLATQLHADHQATLIGFQKPGSEAQMSPLDSNLSVGDTLFYISTTRLADEAFK
jgi:voltage-gated potassium channel